MATKYINQIADDGEYVRYSVSWFATAQNEQLNDETLIDVSALAVDPNSLEPCVSLSITKVWFNGHLSIENTTFGDNAFAVHLKDSTGGNIIAFDRDADGYQDWECFGGLPDTRSYGQNATGDLRIGMYGGSNSNHVHIGSGFHIIIECRKNYQRPSSIKVA